MDLTYYTKRTRKEVTDYTCPDIDKAQAAIKQAINYIAWKLSLETGRSVGKQLARDTIAALNAPDLEALRTANKALREALAESFCREELADSKLKRLTTQVRRAENRAEELTEDISRLTRKKK